MKGMIVDSSRGRLFGPISDVQGFSMRDGLTHLEIQENMRRKLLELIASQQNLINYVRTSNGTIEDEYFEKLALFDSLNDSYTARVAEVDLLIDTVKLSVPLNVKEFGAVGNGIADDSAHIQAALTAAGVGGRVFLPKGVYRCGSPITVPEFCTLEGSTAEFNTDGSPVQTEIKFPNLVGNAVGITFASNGTLRNILVRGPGYSVGTVVGTKATNSVRFDRVSVCEFAIGTEIYNAYYAIFTDSEWLRNGYGLKMSECFNVNLFAPRFSCVNGAGWGTAISGKARGLNIFGGAIESYAVGINMLDASHLRLDGVYFETDNGSNAVGVLAAGSINVSVDIDGCVIYTYGHTDFLKFTGASHFILNSHGNRFHCADSSLTVPTAYNGVSGNSNSVDIAGDTWVEVAKVGAVYVSTSLVGGPGCRVVFPPTFPVLGGMEFRNRVPISAPVGVELTVAGAVPAFDVSCSGTVVTLYANATASTLPSGIDGQVYTVTFKQYTAGGKTYVWPTNCKFAGGAAPSDTTVNRETSVTFRYNGGLWYEISRAVAVG